MQRQAWFRVHADAVLQCIIPHISDVLSHHDTSAVLSNSTAVSSNIGPYRWGLCALMEGHSQLACFIITHRDPACGPFLPMLKQCILFCLLAASLWPMCSRTSRALHTWSSQHLTTKPAR